MKCQRCLGKEDAIYRVYSDEMDMSVCAGCAEEARKIGISIEFLDPAGRRSFGVGHGETNRAKLSALSS